MRRIEAHQSLFGGKGWLNMSAGPEVWFWGGPPFQDTTSDDQQVPLSGVWVVIVSKAATVHAYDQFQQTKTIPKVRQCPVCVERRVESEYVTCLALHGGYTMDIHSFCLCRPPITLGITISTHLLRLLKVRGACHMRRPTLKAFRRLSCRICVTNDISGCIRVLKAYTPIFHSQTPQIKGMRL
jgi:hypothetical protein